MRVSVLCATLALSASLVTAQERFLTLPHDENPVAITSGWFYDSGVPHRGIDYAPTETETFEVRATADGKAVATRSERSGFGEFIIQVHDETDLICGRIISLYVHLALGTPTPPFKPLPEVRSDIASGDFSGWTEVARGDLLGIAGNTGRTQGSGVHLHYEVNCGGYAEHKTDPYDIEGYSWQYPEPCGTDYLWTACPPVTTPPEPVIPNTLVSIERDTGNIVAVPLVGSTVVTIGNTGDVVSKWYGIEYDPTTDTLFGSGNTHEQVSMLYAINKYTGVVTPIGPFELEDDFYAVSDMAIRPDGTLFGLAMERHSRAQLVSIDKATGTATYIGPLGQSQFEGLTWDDETEALYASVRYRTKDGFFLVDTETGVFTRMSQGGALGVIGLADRLGTGFYGLTLNTSDRMVILCYGGAPCDGSSSLGDPFSLIGLAAVWYEEVE